MMQNLYKIRAVTLILHPRITSLSKKILVKKHCNITKVLLMWWVSIAEIKNDFRIMTCSRNDGAQFSHVKRISSVMNLIGENIFIKFIIRGLFETP
jgi:hypothetical protein